MTTKTWRRSTPLAKTRTPDLTDGERANVRKALVFLRVRLGGYRPLAASLGVTAKALGIIGGPKGRAPTVALALRVARVAKVSVEAILAGEWPPEGACPHCGRG
jgi:hypothetical protein